MNHKAKDLGQEMVVCQDTQPKQLTTYFLPQIFGLFGRPITRRIVPTDGVAIPRMHAIQTDLANAPVIRGNIPSVVRLADPIRAAVC